MKIAGTYLNPEQREQFNHSWERIKKKKKTDSAKSVFEIILVKAIGVTHSAK
jgi:hypothetical protein